MRIVKLVLVEIPLNGSMLGLTDPLVVVKSATPVVAQTVIVELKMKVKDQLRILAGARSFIHRGVRNYGHHTYDFHSSGIEFRCPNPRLIHFQIANCFSCLKRTESLSQARP